MEVTLTHQMQSTVMFLQSITLRFLDPRFYNLSNNNWYKLKPDKRPMRGKVEEIMNSKNVILGDCHTGHAPLAAGLCF
jgi:hypothetical protein